MWSFVQRYLLPGFVFQGVVIGGGYATGRELIEFFFPSGPLGGLIGMLVVAAIWGLVMAISFELCRMHGTYEYRGFFRRLIGRYWVFYEILLLMTMILALAVIGSATGEIVRDQFGLHEVFGTLALFIAIGTLAFFGTDTIEKFMGSWSILIYAAYIYLIISSLTKFGGEIASNFNDVPVASGWFVDAVRYAGYNVAAVPVVLFCLKHIKRRREAVCAGLLGGVIAILPAMMFYVALMADYPAIGEATIPSVKLLGKLGIGYFSAMFQIILIGTFVQTGVGLVHTVNQRIEATLESQGMVLKRYFRPVTACAILFVALGLATYVGIVDLIAKGYGVLTWGFILVFVVPTLTLGLARVLRSRAANI